MTEKLAILFLMRYRWRLQRRSAVWRVLLVGSRDDAENYLELVREHPEWNLEIVDVVPASPDGTAMRRNGELDSTNERQLVVASAGSAIAPSRSRGRTSLSAMRLMRWLR